MALGALLRALVRTESGAKPALRGVVATAEYLCRELDIEGPSWLADVPPCQTPWFVSGMENLKAIALAESPLSFRWRKIFVTESFLSRV